MSVNSLLPTPRKTSAESSPTTVVSNDDVAPGGEFCRRRSLIRDKGRRDIFKPSGVHVPVSAATYDGSDRRLRIVGASDPFATAAAAEKRAVSTSEERTSAGKLRKIKRKLFLEAV